MVARAVPLALFPIDPGVFHAGGERRGAQLKVDAHPLILREPPGLVVPVGVLALGVGAHRIDEPFIIEQGIERLAFGGGNMGEEIA